MLRFNRSAAAILATFFVFALLGSGVSWAQPGGPHARAGGWVRYLPWVMNRATGVLPATDVPTRTPTPTATQTASATASVTATPSPTGTRVPGATDTATATATKTVSPSPTSTSTRTPTLTATASRTPTATATATRTSTATATATFTVPPPSDTPTHTPTATATSCSTQNVSGAYDTSASNVQNGCPIPGNPPSGTIQVLQNGPVITFNLGSGIQATGTFNEQTGDFSVAATVPPSAICPPGAVCTSTTTGKFVLGVNPMTFSGQGVYTISSPLGSCQVKYDFSGVRTSCAAPVADGSFQGTSWLQRFFQLK